MGKFIQINALAFKKREHAQNNPNEIDQSKLYTIILNTDYVHNVREIKFNDTKNKDYVRYQVSTIANNNVSGHYISKESFDFLKNLLDTDPNFGLIIIP